TGNPHSITLTDLSTYDHKDLQNLQGGQANEYYHLTSSEHIELNAWLDDVVLSDGGAMNIGAGDITTEGSIITTTAGGQIGRFMTGSSGNTVFAYTGGAWDIRAGNGNNASQNVLRVDNSGNFDFYSGNLITLGTLGAGATTVTSLTIPTTGEINFRDTDISIGSTLFDGILDMSADISIDMFYDNADVGDEVDGQSLNINRRATEGDDYISLYIDKDRKGLIGFSGDDDLLQLAYEALTVNGTITATGAVDAPAHNISDKKITVTAFTSTGINAAIDALGAEGGEVYLPEGTYTIDSTITFDYDNTVLRGAGFGTYLDATSYNGHPILISGKSNCQVRDLYVKGSAGSGYTQNLITDGGVLSPNFVCFNVKVEDADNYGINWSASGVSYGLFINVTCNNADSHGLFIYGGQYNRIINCSATSNGGWGIGVYRTANIIQGCSTFTNAGDSIYGSIGSVIKDNTCISNTGGGILVNGANCIIIGNFVSLNTEHGIETIGDDQVVANNTVSSSGNNKIDIFINGSDDSVISGNQCSGNVGRAEIGIYLAANSLRNNIVGNVCQTHDTVGISILAGANNNHIEGNQLENEAVAKISDNGSNNTIVNAIAGVTTHYQELLMDTDKKFNLRDSAIGIYSQADTFLDLFADGAVRIGDSSAGAPTNYSKFEPDGTLEFNGTATVFNDLVLPLDFAKVPASNAPNWESFVGNLNAFAYQVNDFQEFTTELLHNYKSGSTFEFHIHGALNATLAGGDETAKFEIEYSIVSADFADGIGEVYPSPTIISAEITIPNGTADLTNIYLSIGTDSTGSFINDATIKGRIRRIASSGTELVGDVFLTQVGVHYEIDTVGSRTITTK
ncbi:hypothetical protein LCGC14_1839820, partial [marine sediment metagenome]